MSKEKSLPTKPQFSIGLGTIVFGLFLLGIALRFYEIGLRPVHHDESLHGTYSGYVYNDQENGFYKYDPMLHGPLLYTVTAELFSIFGPSTATLRSLNAILGSFLILTPFFFRRYLSAPGVIATTAFITLSPSLIYWSRFAHHDYLVLFAYFLFAAGVFLFQKQGGIILVCISIALQYCIKANVFVFLALITGFLIFELLVSKFLKERSLCSALFGHLKQSTPELAIGVVMAGVLFSALYSGNFRHPEGILDGLYRKVFPYWIEQHKIQRIEGPFAFHLLVLFLYELPLVILSIISVRFLLSEFPKNYRFIFYTTAIVSLIAAFCFPSTSYEATGSLKAHLKLTGWFDFWSSAVLAVLAVLVTLYHRMRKETALSFFGYFAFGTTWTYGFLGEKVPWLTIYPLTALLLYLALYFDRSSKARAFFSKKISLPRLLRTLALTVLAFVILGIVESLIRIDPQPLSRGEISVACWSVFAVVICSFLEGLKFGRQMRTGTFLAIICAAIIIKSTIITNYTQPGSPPELLAQVHTTQEMDTILKSFKKDLEDKLRPTPGNVLITGATVWPATWYLRNLSGYHFSAKSEEYPTMDYMILDENDATTPQDFQSRIVPLQSWWVPDYRTMRLKHLFKYAFTHKTWNPTGALNVRLLTPYISLPEEEVDSLDDSASDESEDYEDGSNAMSSQSSN